MDRITSHHNPKIKFLIQLRDRSRIRKKEKLFIIEGKREIKLALAGNYFVNKIYYCSEIISLNEIIHLSNTYSNTMEITEITLDIYQKVAYRNKTEGVLAIAQSKNLQLSDLKLHSKNPLILVAEAPEKPGNIGALLRTADAAKVDAVLIANPKTDIYNPNIIRSSIGCIFTNRIATGTTSEIIAYLKNKNILIFGAALQASIAYHQIDYTLPTAIIMGTEDMGLTQEWLKNTTQNIKIPMSGVIDSMNVSVAAGILIFEAKRQRGFSNI